MFPFAGYMGTILRVNLSTGEAREVSLREDLAEKFVGGRGIGARLLYEEVREGADPLGVENKIIFMTGPLTGCGAPATTRLAVLTKSPLTGIYLVTLMGGNFGPKVKASGFDGLIIEGRAEKPSYILVDDGKASIRSAGKYWGMMTSDAERYLKEDAGKDTEVACIGPAGERLGLLSCIISDRRAAGRGGAGAVMGSKNLKAVVVKGNQKVRLASEQKFREARNLAYKRLRENPATRTTFPKYGTPGLVSAMNEAGVLPTMNFGTGVFGGAEEISGETMRERFVVKDKACVNCVIVCQKITLARDGSFAGYSTEGPEYETIYSMGSNLGNPDFRTIIAADRLCDEYGLDSISTGVVIGFAMECYEKKIIGRKDADGMELKFGNHEIVPELIRKIALKEGLGRILAEGVMRGSKQLGKDSDYYALHVKGLELPGYDPRGMQGMGLNYATACRGACHCRGYTTYSEIFRRQNPWPTDRFAVQGKGKLVKTIQDIRALYDSCVFCTFSQGAYMLEVASELINSVTGLDLDEEDLFDIGHRVNTIERAFNVRHGVRRRDDTLPRRLLEEPMPSGAAKGHVVDLEPMLDEYYDLRGWDRVTGIPSQQAMKDAGLQDLAEDLRGL